MVILGIDPGFAIVGWGIIRFERARCVPLAFGSIQTPAGMDFSERLRRIHTEMDLLLTRYRPEAASVETAIEVAEARGVILLSLCEHQVPLFEYTPLQVKSAVTGFGQAEKPQVMEMTRRRLGLPEVPRPDDTADALALAICHTQQGGTALKRRLMRG